MAKLLYVMSHPRDTGAIRTSDGTPLGLLLNRRKSLKIKKMFPEADKIRDKIKDDLGMTIEDTNDGMVVKAWQV